MTHSHAELMEQPLTVLVVDDDPAARDLLVAALDGTGCRWETADSGESALKLLRDRYYPVVISDWIMPKLDGIQLCKAVRALGGPYTYYMVAAMRNNQTHRLLALDAGVDDVLPKPIDKDDLASRINHARRVIALEASVAAAHRIATETQTRLSDAQKLLMTATQRFEELFDGLPIACFTFDHEFRIREWNRESEDLFQTQPFMAVDRQVWDVFRSKSKKPWARNHLEGVLQGEVLHGVEWAIKRPDGRTCHMVVNIFPLRGLDGAVRGAICANVDITLRKEAMQQSEASMRRLNEIAMELERERLKLQDANKQLEHLAVTDALTGLRNRRAFQALFEEEFAKHLRTENPLSLIILDVDRFKNLNDKYGHTAGDHVLRILAEVLQRSSNVGEYPARYGGEEFVIVLPNVGAEHAFERAEAYRLALESEDFKYSAVTASFGVATASGRLTDAKKLIDQADEALYEAKRQGRNRSIHYRQMIAERLSMNTRAA